MRIPIVFHILRRLLLVILCLSSLWSVSPCLDIDVGNGSKALCLGGKKHPRLRRQNDNFSMRAMVEAAQARAYLSPTVFLGTLRSVLVQRDGTVRAWFSVENPLKSSNTSTGGALKRREDIEVVYYRSGEHCILEVNQENLKLASQYLVFGIPSERNSWPSMTATALPIPNDKRTLRAVKKILCKDCAKPPSLSGLQKVRVEEGAKVRLNCHLAGNPIPWVEWYKDGAKVASKGRVRVKTKRRTSRLIIRRARTSDRGVYECRAGNIVQKDPVSIKATVAVTRKKTTKIPLPTTSTPAPTIATTESSPWTTEPCPTNDFCLNGGTCTFYKVVREYVCHCAEGFVGLRCDYKDVSISLGEVKNIDQNHDRLFVDILVLFLIFFCLNWACIGICWLCCLRCQHSNWGKFQEMAPLRKFFVSENYVSEKDKDSVDVALEFTSSNNISNNRKWTEENEFEKQAEEFKRKGSED